MPTFFRADTRTWRYIPYGQADFPTREAFDTKARRHGALSDQGPRRWRCGVCGSEWGLDEIGVSFGDAAIGTPLCPTEACTAIGWDYFTGVREDGKGS